MTKTAQYLLFQLQHLEIMSEVVREGLRLVEERKLQALRETLAASLAEEGSFTDSEVGEAVEAGLAASDIMRAGPRRLEKREAHLDALRAALVEGEQSGPPTPFDFEAFIARRQRKERPSGNDS